MAKKWEVPFLGRIPIDPKLGAMYTGRNFFKEYSSSEAASVFKNIALAIST